MSALYQLLDKGVRDLDSGERIPPDKSDARWRAYLAARAAGEVPLPVAAPSTQPAPADLIAALNNEAQLAILRAYPIWYQCNCATGIYPPEIADKMRDDIAAVIAEANRCTDLIEAGQLAIPEWPTIGD